MTRLVQKELRTLAVPVAIVLGAILLAASGSSAWGPRGPRPFGGILWALFTLAFLVGMSLVAATPFGSEFRSRTMALLLAQPISRTRIWLTKWLLSVGAMLVLGAIEAAALSLSPLSIREGYADQVVFAAATYVVMVACSAPLWTLVAGSTIGGMALAPTAILWVELAAFYSEALLNGRPLVLPNFLFAPVPALVAVRAAYCAAAAWLGWRRFAAYETAGARSVNLSADAGSGGWAWLRPRRRTPIANLVRKELMLLRPLYLVAAAFVASWLAVRLFVVPRTPTASVLALVILIVYVAIAAALAATMAAGEDAALGVRPWHLTLPVSSRTQWGVKLSVSLAAGFAFVLLLPALAYWAVPLGSMRFSWAQVFDPWNLMVLAGAVIIGLWATTLVADVVTATVTTGCIVLMLLLLTVFTTRLVPGGAHGRLYILLPAIAVLLPAVATALVQSAEEFGRIRVPRETALLMSLVLVAVSAAGAGTFLLLTRVFGVGM
jgi:hypothetical protein